MKNTLKWLSTALTVIGGILTIATGFVEKAEQKEEIKQAVAEYEKEKNTTTEEES